VAVAVLRSSRDCPQQGYGSRHLQDYLVRMWPMYLSLRSTPSALQPR
jgi:hypothetical protein